jgi:cell division protein FtsZ
LLELADQSMPMVEAFRLADEVLLHGVGGITDLITTPGLINVDFADVRSVMAGAGGAVMGIGRGTGEQRSIQAATKAMASPMLESTMEGASGVLLSISGPSSMTLHEVHDAATHVSEHCDADANIIFGAIVDDAMGDEMRVTVIAAGFSREAADRPGLRAPQAPRPRVEPGDREAPEPELEPEGGDDFEIPDFLKG